MTGSVTGSVKLRMAEPARRAARISRAAAHQGHRIRRGLRVRVGRARMLSSLVAAGVSRSPVFLLLSDLDALSPALQRGLHAAVRSKVAAEVIVLDFAPQSGKHSAAEIPAHLPVRRFWLDAAPNGGGAPPRHSTEGLDPRPAEGRGGDWVDGYYEEGRPQLGVRQEPGSTVVEHYGPGGRAIRLDQLDGNGRLIRIVDLHPSTGRETGHRYFDADGRCWLSVWVDPVDGSLGRTQQHRGEQREFYSYREMQAEWVAGLLAGADRARVLTGGRAAVEVAALAREG